MLYTMTKQLKCVCGKCKTCYMREYAKSYRLKNADKVRSYYKERSKDPEVIKANKEAQSKFRKSGKLAVWRKAYRQKDEVKAKEAAYQKEYLARPEVKESRASNRRKYLNERYRNDPIFRMKVILRSRLRLAIKKHGLNANVNHPSAVRDLGCSIPEFRSYLESKFLPGMTWDNWTRIDLAERSWNIDHIKPLSCFDLSDPEQVKQAVHYTNLQPMWSEDNLSKSDTFNELSEELQMAR